MIGEIYRKIIAGLGLHRILMRLHSDPFTRQLMAGAVTSYLEEVGWHLSNQQGEPVDSHANPIPWLTYPFLDFIHKRLKREMRLFEFGSGNSTIYWAKHVGEVISVEGDPVWYAKISAKLPTNAKLLLRDIGSDSYFCALTSQIVPFDIIIVDGRRRVEAVRHALHLLNGGGVIVLDNFERCEYAPAADFLQEEGFKRLEFWGMTALVASRHCTVVFYRANNCLGI